MSLFKYGCLLALCALPSAPALAGGKLAPGDGSWASNPAIFSPVPAADQSAEWTPADRIEDDNTLFGLDWSLGTRGSFIHDSSGDRYEAVFTPRFSLEHTGTRLSYGTAVNGEFKKTQDGFNVDDLLLSGTSVYEFDPEAKLEANASLAMAQEDPHAPDVPANEVTTPVEISGAADTAYTQTLGLFSLSLKGNVARDTYGPTGLSGGVIVDNSSQNNTRYGGGLRLGFALTPILEPFVDAEVQRAEFDAADPTLLTKLDGNQYTLMAGVTATWGDLFSASASAGVGLEHFDNPALADVQATLLDASLTYRPTEALSLVGNFTTSIGAPGPNGGGTAKIEYQATAAATYLVNEWLDWRGSAGWHDAQYAGSSSTDTGYDLGIGADYLINEHLKLSADYGFDHSVVSPNPADDTQTISVGMTLQK